MSGCKDIQGFSRTVEDSVCRPALDHRARAEIAVARGHRRHACRAPCHHVALVVAVIHALLRPHADLAHGLGQRRGMRLGVGGVVSPQTRALAVLNIGMVANRGVTKRLDLLVTTPQGTPWRASACSSA